MSHQTKPRRGDRISNRTPLRGFDVIGYVYRGLAAHGFIRSPFGLAHERLTVKPLPPYRRHAQRRHDSRQPGATAGTPGYKSEGSEKRGLFLQNQRNPVAFRTFGLSISRLTKPTKPNFRDQTS